MYSIKINVTLDTTSTIKLVKVKLLKTIATITVKSEEEKIL